MNNRTSLHSVFPSRFAVLALLGLAMITLLGMPLQSADAQIWGSNVALQSERPEAVFVAGADAEWVIQDILARLVPPDASSIDRYQFEVNLRLADRETLRKIAQTTTFAEAAAILLPASRMDAGTVNAITQKTVGDLDRDYVYTAVSPCRIVDTRPSQGGTGGFAPRTSKDFFVYGDGATIGGQGGNPNGCPSPRGEPRAVHINVTAVPGGSGFLTIFPTNVVGIPNVSLINYRSDRPIANAGIIQTTFAIGPELRVFSSTNVNVVIDVLGYFHEAGAIDSDLLPDTLFFTSTAQDGSGVAVTSCPIGSLIGSANCDCSGDGITRNFGILFSCQVAGNGAVGGCFSDGLTFDPGLLPPLATVTAMCIASVPAAGSLTGTGQLNVLSPASSSAAEDTELDAKVQLLRNEAASHTQRLGARK